MSADRRDKNKRVMQAEDLNLANGLLVLLDSALAFANEGDSIQLRSTDTAGVDDLVSWAKHSGHRLEWQAEGDSITYTVTAGKSKKQLINETPDWGLKADIDESGKFQTANWNHGRMAKIAADADPRRGFAPRGAICEEHSPAFAFSLSKQRQVWALEVADLYDQAVANQWDAARDIAWNQIPELPEEIERAICQIMTFLIENEYSALYVPGKFISRIHPEYTEVVLFLSTQLMDEARHIEAFTKRALANGGGLQICTASTEHSLKSLFDQSDFSCASFLLSVLGEGTFLDLLRFIEDYAPDAVTADIVKRARADETRHVHFGMAHIRYLISQDASTAEKLIAAVTERASSIGNVTSVNEYLTNALTTLAGGGITPAQLKEGSKRVSSLYKQMHDNRQKRLISIGFSDSQAELISSLHTPNFM